MSVRILGVEFHPITQGALNALIDDHADDNCTRLVVTATIMVMAAQRDQASWILENAHLIVPDGWASNAAYVE